MLKAGSAWLSQATLGQFRVTDYNVVSIPYCAQTFCSQCDSSCDVCTNHPSANSDFCGFQSSGGVTELVNTHETPGVMKLVSHVA